MQNPNPSPQDLRQFAESMTPQWKEISLLLGADRPPDWLGLKFEASILRGAGLEFSVRPQYGDRCSNRKRNVPQPVVDKVAKLYVEYRNFSPVTEWKSIVIEHIWMSATKSWKYECRWEYVLNSGSR